MPNLIKKMNKAGVGLHPGEQIVEVLILHPKGTSVRVAGGAIASGLVNRLKKDERGELITDEGLAERMPDGPLVLNMTGTRILACSMSKMSGKPTKVDAEFSIDDIAAIDVGKDRIGPPVVIAFSDGTARVYETPMRNKFVEGFAGRIG